MCNIDADELLRKIARVRAQQAELEARIGGDGEVRRLREEIDELLEDLPNQDLGSNEQISPEYQNRILGKIQCFESRVKELTR